MNENHQRHLLSTFQHVDNLLSEAERILASADSASPFQPYAQDSTPRQREVAHEYALRVRQAMRRILEELRIPAKQQVSGAIWAARSQISFAGIAIAETDSKHMRGYGALSEEDAQTVNRIVAELNGELSRLGDYLAQGDAANAEARLGQTRDEQGGRTWESKRP